MIDQFADATDDHQFIHCDPERHAGRRWGTIAHGFLSPRCLAMTFETMPPLENSKMGVNHGSITALPGAGEDRRAHPHRCAGRRQGQAVGCRGATHHRDRGPKKPALTARWLTLTLIERQPETA
jgi:hypothetical protein